MTYPDNPAGRLYSILHSVIEKGGTDDKINDVLAEVFGIQPDNRLELFNIYVELLQLVRTSKSAVENLHGVDNDLYIRPFERLERGFSILSLNNKWLQLREYLDDSTLTALMFCSDTLSNRIGEKSISNKEIAKLQKEVEALLDTMVTIKLDDSLRTFLIDRLEHIRKAILYYRIKGADGLKEALENTIGSMYLFRTEKEEENHEKDDSAMNKVKKTFIQIIEHLSKLVSFAKDTKELLGGDMPLLGP